MTSRLMRLSAALRSGASDEQKWKARAVARASAVTRLKQTIETLRERLARAQARLEQMDESRKASNDRLRLQRVLLRQTLAVRAHQMPISSHDRAAADARDRHLREVSVQYRAAFDDIENPMIEKIAIDGLDWWVPMDPRVADRAERTQRQGLPLGAILQTRELAMGGVMLDLGANLGRTSIPRVLLGDVRAVYAAEPFPTNYAALVRNVREYNLQGFVLPDQVAIGAERGVLDLRVSRYPGGHRILHKRRRPVETIAVAVWPVDEWIARVGVEPEAISFVKIDTQGSEVRVLQGASALLGRGHIAWQMEIDPVLLKRAGTPVRDLCALTETRFTHFIDLGRPGDGPRSLPVAMLREVVGPLATAEEKTDVLFYHAR